MPHNATETPIPRLLTVTDLTRILQRSRRELERMRAAGRFPPPDLKLGPRSPRWRAETVERWIADAGRA